MVERGGCVYAIPNCLPELMENKRPRCQSLEGLEAVVISAGEAVEHYSDSSTFRCGINLRFENTLSAVGRNGSDAHNRHP